MYVILSIESMAQNHRDFVAVVLIFVYLFFIISCFIVYPLTQGVT